ncbi:SAM-dependent methyltransferase [Pseudofrankia sp. DC12]|uniref:SAM-dependent methyltransferase n=1 Tax=Pseudofrankia sp. DC12 TaxID=683315 RepID=UPI0005F7E79D|nr:SAM-dependent methyltransferase [Pseudofrankia sp. DC12]
MLDEQIRIGKKAARRTVEWGHRNVVRPVRWGNLRRTGPFSDWYGNERGWPADRRYIDGFIERHRADLVGHVMEIKTSHYVDQFGRPDEVTIVDIDRENSKATLFADLDEPGSLPAGAFNAAIVTNTIQYLEPQPALANLWQSLTPGGVLLLTAPALARTDAEIPEIDYVRYTPAGLRREFTKAGIPAIVEGFGNVLACLCTIYGLTIQDVSRKELDLIDPRFPITVCARAVKPER